MKKILFYGDSIIANFTKLNNYSNVVNLGVGGDKTIELIGRLNEMLNNEPTDVYILIGINDFLVNKGTWDTPLKIPFEDMYNLLIETMKLSEIKFNITTIAILPLNETTLFPKNKLKKYNVEIDKINKQIESLSMKHNISHINFTSHFKDSENNLNQKYTIDGIHLSEDGYKLFEQLIEKHIK